MINITRNSISTANIQAEGVTESVAPYYLFLFWKQGKKSDPIESAVLQPIAQFEKFEIFELPSNITSMKNGLYDYKVYEQDNGSNVDPENTIGLIDIGLARVIGDSETQILFRQKS